MLDSGVNPHFVVKFKLTVDIIDVVLSQGDCLQQGDIRIVNHGNKAIMWDDCDVMNMNGFHHD